MIDTLLNRALEIHGTAGVICRAIGMTESEFSKFRKGDAGVRLHHLEKLFEITDLKLITKQEKDGLINAALKFANLYQEKK